MLLEVILMGGGIPCMKTTYPIIGSIYIGVNISSWSQPLHIIALSRKQTTRTMVRAVSRGRDGSYH